MTLHENVIDIAEDYFGPAAPRLINRLIINHLNKTPEKLTTRDLKDLVSWIKLTLGVVTDEPEVVDELSARLTALSKTGVGSRRR